jgi:hypothetical protein
MVIFTYVFGIAFPKYNCEEIIEAIQNIPYHKRTILAAALVLRNQ